MADRVRGFAAQGMAAIAVSENFSLAAQAFSRAGTAINLSMPVNVKAWMIVQRGGRTKYVSNWDGSQAS